MVVSMIGSMGILLSVRGVLRRSMGLRIRLVGGTPNSRECVAKSVVIPYSSTSSRGSGSIAVVVVVMVITIVSVPISTTSMV